jgi:ABC-2 type transport system permease protein
MEGAMEATLSGPALRPWRAQREAVRATLLLGAREIRSALRMPAIFIPNLLVPIFFYFVMVGSLQEFASQSGVPNWKAFQLPVAIMFAVMSGGSGYNTVVDIESGYFDKLLLTPANRLAIIVGAMAADFMRIFVQASLVVFLAVISGIDFATGALGALVMLLVMSGWGIAFSAIGFAIALKTGNSQAVQSVWALFVPIMFLTTSFAPLEALSGWLKAAATLNPMTYVLEGMRALSMEGWDIDELAIAMLAVGGFATFTFSLAFLALRSRLR